MSTSVVWLAVLLSAVSGTLSGETTSTFYISPKGDDAQGKGTQASPWATVARAQVALRALHNATSHLPGPVDIIMQPGVYAVEKPIVIEAQDTGEEGKTVTFKAADSTQVMTLN